MNSPKVSVIVPIYRAEETLLRCLDSLKAQTFTDFEVLMIDDGSPDSCGLMIDNYAKADSRFKAFHKTNGGVSAARQYGIDHAMGFYTIHADPDDWVEPTMLEELFKKAVKTDADMVICDFFENTYKGQKYVKQRPTALDHLTIQKELFLQLHGSCCNKLVKRTCYSEFRVRFPEQISFCEDQFVNTALLMNDMKVGYLPKAFYHYVRNTEWTLSRVYTKKTYETDLLIRKLFDSLFVASSLRGFVYKRKTYSLLTRAFYGGSHVFTSSEFHRCFYKDRKVIAQSEGPLYERIFIYIACVGFYSLARQLASTLLSLKQKTINYIKRGL